MNKITIDTSNPDRAGRVITGSCTREFIQELVNNLDEFLLATEPSNFETPVVDAPRRARGEQ